MKKILILDVDSCYFCPCSSAEVGWLGNITRSVCQVKGEENTVYMDGVSGVPDWCPLRKIPQKESEKHREEIEDWTGLAYSQGWNDCIDAITGETE